MSSTFGWLVFALAVSYTISYVLDIHSYARARLKILPAVWRQRAPLGLSVILRAFFLGGFMHLVLALLTLLHPPPVDSPWTMPAISIGSAIAVAVGLQPFLILSRLLTKRSHRLNVFSRRIMQLDLMCWGALEHDLSTAYADAILEFTKTEENRLCLLVFYEERKEVIVTHQFTGRPNDKDDRWLYLAFLVGDNNPNRASASVAAYDLRTVSKRIAEIKSDYDSSEVREELFKRANVSSSDPIDIRHMPSGWREWLSNPDLYDKYLETVNCRPRRGDELVRRFLRELL